MIIPDSGAILDSRDVGKDSVDFPSVHNAASHVDNPPDTNDLEDTALMNLYCQAADEVVSLFDSPPARMRKIAHAKGPVELKPAEIVTLNHEQ